MMAKTFIDAAYGVQAHRMCNQIVYGESGPVLAKSAKQKIVTKSSIAELVGLSDTASHF